jgi:hypothetical protein
LIDRIEFEYDVFMMNSLITTRKIYVGEKRKEIGEKEFVLVLILGINRLHLRQLGIGFERQLFLEI